MAENVKVRKTLLAYVKSKEIQKVRGTVRVLPAESGGDIVFKNMKLIAPDLYLASFEVPARGPYIIHLESSSILLYNNGDSQTPYNDCIDHSPVSDMTGAILMKLAMCHIGCEQYQFSTGELHIGESDLTCVLLRGMCMCNSDAPPFVGAKHDSTERVVDVTVKDVRDMIIKRNLSLEGAESSNSVQLDSTPSLGSLCNEKIIESDSEATTGSRDKIPAASEDVVFEWRESGDDLSLVVNEFNNTLGWPSVKISHEINVDAIDQSNASVFEKVDQLRASASDPVLASYHSFLFNKPDNVIFTSWGSDDVYALNTSK